MKAPLILDGKNLAKEIEAELKLRVQKIKQNSNKTPILATILVGGDPASVTYVRMKGNDCQRVGLEPLKIELPVTVNTEAVVAKIQELNDDDNVHGILLQHPVPEHIDEQLCFNTIALNKDVDGVNTGTFGRMSMRLDSFKSATPLAILTLLKHYDINMKGSNKHE